MHLCLYAHIIVHNSQITDNNFQLKAVTEKRKKLKRAIQRKKKVIKNGKIWVIIKLNDRRLFTFVCG